MLAGPAEISDGSSSVTVSLSSFGVTVAVRVFPPDFTVVDLKSISTAFSTMVLVGLSTWTSIVSSPAKVFVEKSGMNCNP